MRGTVESAISICGADIMDGAGLWKRLVDIQMENLEDLIDTGASSDAIREAKEAIVSTYRRQFALPLLGNQRSLSSFETVLSNICIESDAQWIRPEVLLEKFQRSEEQLAARIIYEQNVLSEEFLSSPLSDQVSAWRTYINFEIAEKQLPRAHRLYERSLLTSHQSVELWTEYAEFAATVLKQSSLVESVTGRAVKVHRNNIQLWLQYLIAIESRISLSSFSLSFAQDKRFDLNALTPGPQPLSIVGIDPEIKIMRTVQTALSCTFYSADDYLSILLYSCDFQRRKLQRHLLAINHVLESETTLDCIIAQEIRSTLISGVESLRIAFSDSEGFLGTFYPEWGAGWLEIYKYHVSVEDEIIGAITDLLENNDAVRLDSKDNNVVCEDQTDSLSSKANEVWERAVTRFSKYYFSWGEYIKWGRAAGDFDLCRSLYCRALKAAKDYPEELCKAFILFEQQIGTLQDYCTVKIRTKVIMKNAAMKAIKAISSAKELAKAKSQKKILKATDTAVIYSGTGTGSGTDSAVPAASSSLLVESLKVEGQDSRTIESTENDKSCETKGHERKKRLFEDHATQGSCTISDGGDRNNLVESSNKRSKGDDCSSRVVTNTCDISFKTNKISVKNLSFKSSTEEVSDHFNLCGEIIDCQLLLSKAGKSRGQAIIEFLHHSGVVEGMKLNGSLLSDRPIEVEMILLTSSENILANLGSSSSKPPSAHHPTTVFVSKFSKDLTCNQLREIFKECGDVFEARVIMDKRTGQSKVQCCFIKTIFIFLT